MRIVRFKAENMMKLSAVEITPDGNVVEISGKNGAGKTSILHIIMMMLDWRNASKHVSKPIKEGESNGWAELELDEMTIKGRWKKNGAPEIRITNKEGWEIRSPRALLDKLKPKIGFDPTLFIQMSDKEQVETLLSVIDADINPLELDEQRKELYNRRTEEGRAVKQLEGQIAGYNIPENTPDKEIDISELRDRYSNAVKRNAQYDRIKSDIDHVIDEISLIDSEIKRLQEKKKEKHAQLKKMESETKDMMYADLTDIEEKIVKAEAINKAVARKADRDRVEKNLKESKKRYDDLTERITEIDEKKKTVLENIEFPIEGLGFSEGKVTFNGIPVTQIASSEQMRVGMAIAMALNPELRVVLMEYGSLLDRATYDVVKDMAKGRDGEEYQIWVEIVDDSGEVGIVIEDGRVLKNNYEKETTK